HPRFPHQACFAADTAAPAAPRALRLNPFPPPGFLRDVAQHPPPLTSRVLNAFRHHGVLRKVVRLTDDIVSLVLNAFRHHGVLRLIKPREGRCGVGRSTPFGIMKFCGAGFALGTVARTVCSTPFGITEFCGACPVWGSRQSMACSTPFGITEFCGPAT